MFTRQHYELIAKLLKSSLNLQSFRESIIVAFKFDNDRFDEAKFRKASEKELSQNPKKPKPEDFTTERGIDFAEYCFALERYIRELEA